MLVAGLGSAAASAPVYSLADCINLALERNPDVQAARLDIEAATGGKIAARAVLYPRLSAEGRGGMENEDVFSQRDASRFRQDRTREDWRGSVQISYSIFSGGANRSQIKSGDLEVDRRFILLEEKVNDTVREVKRAFNEVLYRVGEIETQRQIIQILTEEVDRQKKLFDAGRTNRFTVVRAEVRLANQLPLLYGAENGLLNARLELAETTGVPWAADRKEPPFEVTGMLDCPPVPLTVEQAVKTALSARPEADRIGKEIEIAELAARTARASNIPRLDAYASGTQRRDTGTGSSFFDSKSEVAFGLLGRWDIFDGFAGKGRAQQADARAAQLRIERGDSLRRIELEVRRAMAALRNAENTLAAQGENVDRAAEALKLSRSSVEAGYASQFEVLQATLDLNTAQNIELRARLDYHQGLADLERALFTRKSFLTTDRPPEPLQVPAARLTAARPREAATP